jgi:hypothetical protein
MRTFCCAVVTAIMTLASTAFASPFLVSDPNPSAVGGFCDITGASWITNPTPLQSDGSVKVDLANAPVGKTNLQVRVCIDEWGVTLCSPFVPFSFERRGTPSAPGNLRLKKD